ncbi:uncharacterized protein LOC123197308 [Mangifera indica]|uniref:uncharacterized protein LOC123197308 n=1 Tax=Mangifera indica TaxID=29780 RepID=UPI001CF982E1|nr:uncharacterized protein LOC123197308 [Mangifera indica]
MYKTVETMGELCGSNLISTNFGAEFDQLDHLPLLSRRKLLLATKTTLTSGVDVAVKKEEDNEGLLSPPSACSVGGIDQQLVLKESHSGEAPFRVTSVVLNGDHMGYSTADEQCLPKAPCGEDVCMLGDSNSQRIITDKYACPDQIVCPGVYVDVAGLEKVSIGYCTSCENPASSSVPSEVKVENFGNHVFSSLGDIVNGFASVDAPADKGNNVITNEFADDNLDHIVLKERQRMLLTRRSLESGNSILEGNSIGSGDLVDPNAGTIKEEIRSLYVDSSVTGNEYNELSSNNVSFPGISSESASSEFNSAGSSVTTIPGCSLVTEETKSRYSMNKSESEFSSCGGQHDVVGSCSVHAPTLQNSVKVKVEPLENVDLALERNVFNKYSCNAITVKGENNELYGVGVDHMRLHDRMKLRTSGENFEFDSSRIPSLQKNPVLSESAEPIRVNHPRKRKKTATGLVETAMEEDAPGLLQVLVEQGVSVDEIKLYGEMEDDDDLDEMFCKESFSELEAVMAKLFFQRNCVLKFAPVRCAKGSKPSYCLGCLFSLVEQTRYLQFRKWPVEWGWCRDLQSFIFVFKRHNRLVLERPEYGYATYFFELVDSLPIDWQIKRLVTAMKLTSCGRVNLIENKALLVGKDLTEGEAKVLMGFGWIPNTGLGTMLNYRDRVFHDRKNEKETSEWRSKIGKLLVDGYNGGTIVLTNNPCSVVQDTTILDTDTPQVKLELS